MTWERINHGYDLLCIDPNGLDRFLLKKLLRKVEKEYADFDKRFSKDASGLLGKWIESPTQSLEEADYVCSIIGF